MNQNEITGLLDKCSTPDQLLKLALKEVFQSIAIKYDRVVHDNKIVMPEVGQVLTGTVQPVYTPEVKLKMLGLFNELNSENIDDIQRLIKLNRDLNSRDDSPTFSDPEFFYQVQKLNCAVNLQMPNFELIQIEEGIDNLFFMEEIALQNIKIKAELIAAIVRLINNITN